MADRFDVEDELLQLKSELRFLSYAVEQTLTGMQESGVREDDANEIGFGFHLCFSRVFDRLDTLERHVMTDK